MTKILIIEDETGILANVKEVLQLEGLDTIEATDGVAGIQLALEQAPDLILCDIKIPEVDGFGVLKSLRQNPETATIPFVVMSARTDPADISTLLEMGANSFLSKPFKITELLNSIYSLLGTDAQSSTPSLPALPE